MNHIKTIAFDADDTLWVNETFFRETEVKFAALMADEFTEEEVTAAHYDTEVGNMPLYGYGVKAYTLSLIETVMKLRPGKDNTVIISKTLKLGKAMLEKPVELLEGVEEVLRNLNGRYRLVLATKGDLLDQERKLTKSGLEKYFHHIEVMSNKEEEDYRKLLKRLDCPAEAFMMVGNSVRSDILPVINLGGSAMHVPFHTTWAYESTETEIKHKNLHTGDVITDLLEVIRIEED